MLIYSSYIYEVLMNSSIHAALHPNIKSLQRGGEGRGEGTKLIICHFKRFGQDGIKGWGDGVNI